MQEGAGAAADAGTKAAASRPVLPPPTLRFNDLRDNPGAHIRKRKKGRGVGGGHGLARSAGEGSKGQKSHEGGGIPFGFEGGQSPLWRRTPKFGYMAKIFRVEMQPVNLHKLQLWVDTGRIDPSQRITLKTLVDAGLVSNVKDGVKLLGTVSTTLICTAQHIVLLVHACAHWFDIFLTMFCSLRSLLFHCAGC